MKKQVSDEELIVALLTCSSKSEAAELLGISKQTISNRLKKEDFRKQLNSARTDILKATSQSLINASSKAAQYLVELLDNPNENTAYRLDSAKTFLRLSKDFWAFDELQERVEKLEDEFADIL